MNPQMVRLKETFYARKNDRKRKNLYSTSQSYRKAESFYRQAAERGNEYAKNALKRIKEKLVEEEELYLHQKVENTTYTRVIPFGENYIVKRKYLWSFFYEHNTPLLPIEYDYIHCFDGGYAGIQKNGLWGLADSMGTIAIEPQYETLHYLSRHQACDAESGGDKFLVDTNNNIILRVSGKTIKILKTNNWNPQTYTIASFINLCHSTIKGRFKVICVYTKTQRCCINQIIVLSLLT